MSKATRKVINEYANKPPETKCPDGFVDFEIVGGVEGPCLTITHDHGVGGYRLAGPKPWGGGRVQHRFRVKVSELLEQIKP